VIERINGRLALLVAVMLVLVVVLAGWFTLLSPERSKAAALDGQIDDANVSLASTQALLGNPGAHQSVGQLAQLRRALPDDPEMSEIMRELAWAAGRTGVRIDSITPSAPVSAVGAQAVPITLQVTGRYFRIANFMHLIRTRAKVEDGVVHVKGRLYAIDSVSLAKSNTGGLITATLALDAFASGSAPAPATTTTPTTP
jgi:Tfp pilus assembly protein PilO